MIHWQVEVLVRIYAGKNAVTVERRNLIVEADSANLFDAGPQINSGVQKVCAAGMKGATRVDLDRVIGAVVLSDPSTAVPEM